MNMIEVTTIDNARTSDKGKLTDIKQVMVVEYTIEEVLTGAVLLYPIRAV